MIQNDGLSIPDNYLEHWAKTTDRFIDRFYDNMFARNILEVRKVDESVQIDVVVDYTSTGPGAKIVAKGSVPTGKTGMKQATLKQDIFQFFDQFNVQEKDLKSSPELFDKSLVNCLKNIHRLEDSIAVNGDTTLNLTGIVAAAQANTNGSITAALNNGVWGSATQDPHADMVAGMRFLDGNYSDEVYLAGNPLDLAYLFNLDSERQPYWKTIAPLFGYSETDNPYKTWLKRSKQFTAGSVYLCSKSADVAEFVVSENPYPDRLPKAAGGNYPVEVKGWAVPRIYVEEGFVEIVVGTTS